MNTDLNDIGDIIGDKTKIRMILALYRNGEMKKTKLYSFVSKNSLNPRKLEELESAELVVLKHDRFDNNSTTVNLTIKGQAAALILLKLDDLLLGTIDPEDVIKKAGEQNQMDCGSPSEEGNTVKE